MQCILLVFCKLPMKLPLNINLTIPNLLTFLRIVLIPAFVVVFYLPWRFNHLAAAVIFMLAAVTDWLDGYLARNLNQMTKLGAFLDPVADKLMVAIALVMIVGEIGGSYVAVPAAVIVGREIVISALREWMAEIGKRTSVAVGMVGKVKTAMQMVALILLLVYQPFYGIWLKTLGLGLLYAAAGLTLWSMVMYIKTAWPDLTLE
jgi:CDP-diacylglycerol---glycerol-3-phosphate 3-phosphatidyltransferase